MCPSHASLAEELRALRLHLIGRELATLDERRRAATSERDRLHDNEVNLRTRLDELDAAADAAAAELSSRREDGPHRSFPDPGPRPGRYAVGASAVS